jgi:hypothetical protein
MGVNLNDYLLMNFSWALEQMKLGKKVRCKSWSKKDTWITLSGDLFVCQTGKQAYFMREHFTANDWELYKITISNFNDLAYTSKDFSIRSIKPAHTIQITSPNKKSLTLDFNGDCLITYGDLDFDEASKIFFDSLDGFFRSRLDEEKEKIIAKLKS